MGVSPANFTSAGQTTSHYIPGVYSRRNTQGSSTGVSAGNLCILGVSKGGKPLTLMEFADLAEAKETLISGQLLEAIGAAFNGSSEFVPQKVFAMRVNAGTRAESTLTSGNNDILKVSSADYGSHQNQIKYWLRSGSTTGKKLSVSYKGEQTDVDDIEKKSFTILYNGSTAENVVCSINATSLTLTASDSENAPIESETFTFDFEEYATLSALKERIETTGAYTCNLLDTAEDAKTSELDCVQNVSVKTTAATFYSNLQALIDTFTSIDNIGSVEFVGNQRVLPENNDAWQFLTGGTDGSSSYDDWTQAIDELEDCDIQIIAIPTTNESVQSYLESHCVTMSSVSKKKERTCWFGTAKGTSVEDAVKRAKGINSCFASLVTTGANVSNLITGKTEDVSPSYVACMCAGMESAMSCSNPLTNKALKVNSFERKYKEGELSKLIAGGVVAFGENDDGELVCIRSVTTYQGDSLIKNERSMWRSVLFMDRDLRKACNPRIGTNAEPSESTILATLEKKAKEWYTADMITKGDDGSLYQNAKVRFDGDKCYLTFDRYIRAPNNFVFITATNKVYSAPVELK